MQLFAYWSAQSSTEQYNTIGNNSFIVIGDYFKISQKFIFPK